MTEPDPDWIRKAVWWPFVVYRGCRGFTVVKRVVHQAHLGQNTRQWSSPWASWAPSPLLQVATNGRNDSNSKIFQHTAPQCLVRQPEVVISFIQHWSNSYDLWPIYWLRNAHFFSSLTVKLSEKRLTKPEKFIPESLIDGNLNITCGLRSNFSGVLGQVSKHISVLRLAFLLLLTHSRFLRSTSHIHRLLASVSNQDWMHFTYELDACTYFACS